MRSEEMGRSYEMLRTEDEMMEVMEVGKRAEARMVMAGRQVPDGASMSRWEGRAALLAGSTGAGSTPRPPATPPSSGTPWLGWSWEEVWSVKVGVS